MKIGSVKTERDFFFVAEAGVNHENDLDTAKQMIQEAAKAGADAIKFQTYKTEKLVVRDSPGYWDFKMNPVKSQYELFRQYDKFGRKEFGDLSDYANKNNIIFMSTPFDEESADYLDAMMPIFKISSADITNVPLLKHIAAKGKPVFLSTGASDIDEIRRAVGTLRTGGVKDLTLMHCVLNYPTLYENANIAMISGLKKEFPDCRIGYSDHTIADSNMLVLAVAAALGARVIEKHYTLDKTKSGNDHLHSMDSDDIRMFVDNMKHISKIIGSEKRVPLPSEALSRKFARRSIVACVDIPAKTVIKREMIVCKRPGTGISPADIDSVVGRKVKTDKKADDILFEGDLE